MKLRDGTTGQRGAFRLQREGLFSVLLITFSLLGLIPAACSPLVGPATTPGPTVASPTSTLVPPTSTPVPAAEVTLSPPPEMTLKLWTGEEFSPAQLGVSGQLLADQYEAFTLANPDIRIEYQLKKPYGKGGLRDFLETASLAAPHTLPDLVAVDLFELTFLARKGLVQPLEDLISDELQKDLFPFAREGATTEGHLMGIPFEADIEHLVYNTNQIELPPLTWTDVLTGTAQYVFPAAGEGEGVNDAFLIQYLALGGQLVNEKGESALSQGKLIQVLQFYKTGLEMGIIPPSVLEMVTAEDAWGPYVSATVAMANTTSRRYSADRAQLHNTNFAPVPTRDGNPATIARCWAYAIVTKEPARQAAAARFIEWLLASANTAAWNRQANHLPTRRTAFQQGEGAEDAYWAFAKGLLEVAFLRPAVSNYDQISAALQVAVEEVLGGNLTPAEAAAQVVSVVD